MNTSYIMNIMLYYFVVSANARCKPLYLLRELAPCIKIVAESGVMNYFPEFFAIVQKTSIFEPENSRDDETLRMLLKISELATIWLQKKKSEHKRLRQSGLK